MEQLVKIISPEAQTLAETFGVTVERATEMAKFIFDNQDELFADNCNIATTLNKACSICVHPNEVALQSYAIGRRMSMMSENPISKLLKALM